MSSFEDFQKIDFEKCSPSFGGAARYAIKSVKDKDGNSLFNIDAYEYTLAEYRRDLPPSILCIAQFYRADRTWFTVELHECETMPPNTVVEFFSNIYNGMECVPERRVKMLAPKKSWWQKFWLKGN